MSLGGTVESGIVLWLVPDVSILRYPLPDFGTVNSSLAKMRNFLLNTTIVMPKVSIKLPIFGTGHDRVYKYDDVTVDIRQFSIGTSGPPVGVATFNIKCLRTKL